MQKNSQVQRLVQIIIIIGDACLSPVFLFYFLYYSKATKGNSFSRPHSTVFVSFIKNSLHDPIDLPALINGTTTPDCKLLQPDRSG